MFVCYFVVFITNYCYFRNEKKQLQPIASKKNQLLFHNQPEKRSQVIERAEQEASSSSSLLEVVSFPPSLLVIALKEKE